MKGIEDFLVNEKPGRLGQIKFNYSILSIVVGIGIILVLLYLIFPSYREILKFISAMIGGLAALYAGYYVAATLKYTYIQERIRRSFDLNQKIESVNFTNIRIAINKFIDVENTAPKEVYDKIEGDDKIKSSVVALLNTFETISLAIQYGYVSEEIIYKACAWIIPYYYNKLNVYIDQSRKEEEDSLIWIEVERLVDSWKEKRFLSNGETISEN